MVSLSNGNPQKSSGRPLAKKGRATALLPAKSIAAKERSATTQKINPSQRLRK